MTPPYVPAPGDVVWLQFDPQAGHEQAGYRPALVLSPVRYNAARGAIRKGAVPPQVRAKIKALLGL